MIRATKSLRELSRSIMSGLESFSSCTFPPNFLSCIFCGIVCVNTTPVTGLRWWRTPTYLLNLAQDEVGLKEWLTSLRTAHKCSLELLANMARKAGKIYGTDLDSNNRHHSSPVASRSANGN